MKPFRAAVVYFAGLLQCTCAQCLGFFFFFHLKVWCGVDGNLSHSCLMVIELSHRKVILMDGRLLLVVPGGPQFA